MENTGKEIIIASNGHCRVIHALTYDNCSKIFLRAYPLAFVCFERWRQCVLLFWKARCTGREIVSNDVITYANVCTLPSGFCLAEVKALKDFSRDRWHRRHSSNLQTSETS